MLTVKEAAELADVHIETVRVWIREGRLPASLPARKKGFRIKEDDLEAFLQEKNKVQQKGQVEAEQVLRSLAKAWDKTGHNEYIRIAYEVAELANLLNSFRNQWNDDQGNDFEIERLIEQRSIVLSNLEKDLNEKTRAEEKEMLKKVEGKLILQQYLSN